MKLVEERSLLFLLHVFHLMLGDDAGDGLALGWKCGNIC